MPVSILIFCFFRGLLWKSVLDEGDSSFKQWISADQGPRIPSLTGRRLALAPSSIYTYVYIAGYFCDRESVLYDVKPELGGATFQRLTELSFLMERCMILNDKDAIRYVKLIDAARFAEIIENNRQDLYFQCRNVQEQRRKCDLGSEIKRESVNKGYKKQRIKKNKQNKRE